jgi:endonuclease/exonuclease/phosphatase family metal-dependent hydrolase
VEIDVQLLIKTSRKEILAGDFNAEHVTWNSRKNNAARQVLLNHYDKNYHIIADPSVPLIFQTVLTLSLTSYTSQS